MITHIPTGPLSWKKCRAGGERGDGRKKLSFSQFKERADHGDPVKMLILILKSGGGGGGGGREGSELPSF